MEPPLAGAKPRLRLRLLGLTDLHANIYPYDYYRDRPDDTVGLARAAALIAKARSEGAQFPPARQRRHSPGHAARRLRRRNHRDPNRDPSGDRGDEQARLRRRHARQSRVQLRARVARARYARRAFRSSAAMSATATARPSSRLRSSSSAPSATRPATTRRLKVGVIGFATPQITQWDQAHLARPR